MANTNFKRFVVLRYYGTEGWLPVGGGDTLEEAVLEREQDLLSGGGGETRILEDIPVLEAYARAHLALAEKAS